MSFKIAITLCFILATFFASNSPRSLAAEDDPIRITLNQAKVTFETEAGKHRKGILDALQSREDSARAKGDKKTVDSIKADREAFESTGAQPKSVVTTEFDRKLRQSRHAYLVAYTDAIRGYTKAKEDEKATKVEDEMRLFSSDRPLTGKDSDTRSTWVAKGGAERFDLIEGKNWEHVKAPGKTRTKYVEVARTSDYIELRRTDGMSIRLHDSVFYWGGEADGEVLLWKQNSNPSSGAWST